MGLVLSVFFQVDAERFFTRGVVVGRIAFVLDATLRVRLSVDADIAGHVDIKRVIGGEAVPITRLGKLKTDFMHGPCTKKLVALVLGVQERRNQTTKQKAVQMSHTIGNI